MTRRDESSFEEERHYGQQAKEDEAMGQRGTLLRAKVVATVSRH